MGRWIIILFCLVLLTIAVQWLLTEAAPIESSNDVELNSNQVVAVQPSPAPRETAPIVQFETTDSPNRIGCKVAPSVPLKTQSVLTGVVRGIEPGIRLSTKIRIVRSKNPRGHEWSLDPAFLLSYARRKVVDDPPEYTAALVDVFGNGTFSHTLERSTGVEHVTVLIDDPAYTRCEKTVIIDHDRKPPADHFVDLESI